MASEKVTSKREIEFLIQARYVLLYVVSPEEARVEKALLDIATKRNRKVLAWSITQGFESLDGGSSYSDIRDPLRALDFVTKFEDNLICVLRDFHPFMKDPSVVRKLRDCARNLKESRYNIHLVLLSATYAAPIEIEKELAVVDFDLPERDELEKIVWEVAGNAPASITLGVKTDAEEREAVIEAARGLTADEARSVFAKSLVKKRDFDVKTIMAEKKGIIRKSGILEFYETDQRFSDVGGLEVLKGWLRKRKSSFSRDARDFGLPSPRDRKSVV